MKFKLKPEEIEGYLVGLTLGDGHIETKTNRVVITSNNKDFLNNISKMLENLGYGYSLFFDKLGTTWKLSVRSNKFHRLLTERYSIEPGNKTITKIRPSLEDSQKNYFISGIFDAEGWFEKINKKYLRVRIKMKSKTITEFIREVLDQEGFRTKGRMKDNCFVVEINNKKDVKRFFETFNFMNPKWLRI